MPIRSSPRPTLLLLYGTDPHGYLSAAAGIYLKGLAPEKQVMERLLPLTGERSS